MAKKQPLYGAESSIQAAIADVATTAATNSGPFGYSEAQANALVAAVISIIAALENHGLLES